VKVVVTSRNRGYNPGELVTLSPSMAAEWIATGDARLPDAQDQRRKPKSPEADAVPGRSEAEAEEDPRANLPPLDPSLRLDRSAHRTLRPSRIRKVPESAQK